MKTFRMCAPARLISVLLGAFLLALPSMVLAAADHDLKALRAEIEQMKQAYEARINALEQRLAQAESTSLQAAVVADQAAPRPAAPSGFNPEVSLILQGRYHNAEGDGHITGFLPAGHGHGSD